MTKEILYKFRCEYCGEEYTVTQTLQYLTERERNKIQKNAEKWKYAVPKSGKCPHCGFVPTFMINRMQTVGVIVFLIILLGVDLIPLFVANPPVSLTITLGLVCYLPIVVALVFLILRLIPNRKLLKELSSTDRQLSPPTRPQIIFGPEPRAGKRMDEEEIIRKMEQLGRQEIIRDLEQLSSTDAGLKLALSPLLDMLTSGTEVDYDAAALMLDQIVDELEKTGVADAATISKLRKTEAKPKREVEPVSTVDAMLAIFIHDPDTLLTDLPSGDRLKSIAAGTLQRHDPTQKLYASAYVRAIVTVGEQSMAEQEAQARRDAPGMMKDVLQERELDAEGYKLEVWAEELNPKITVVWVAAIRK